MVAIVIGLNVKVKREHLEILVRGTVLEMGVKVRLNLVISIVVCVISDVLFIDLSDDFKIV